MGLVQGGLCLCRLPLGQTLLAARRKLSGQGQLELRVIWPAFDELGKDVAKLRRELEDWLPGLVTVHPRECPAEVFRRPVVATVQGVSGRQPCPGVGEIPGGETLPLPLGSR